jgi:hypothetical protein
MAALEHAAPTDPEALADPGALAAAVVAALAPVAELLPDDEMLEHAGAASPSPATTVTASTALARRDMLLIWSGPLS